MTILKIAQRVDAVSGLALALVGIYLIFTGSYFWGGAAVLSAAVSFASAKYVPARWLAKRMMLARLK